MKRTSIRRVAAVVLAIGCAGITAACSFRGKASKPVLPQNQMWMDWRTYPPDDVEYKDNQLCRLSGVVMSWIRQNGAQGYYLECNGIQVPVQVQSSWNAAADLPMRNSDLFILGEWHPSADGGFVQEVYRYPLDDTADVKQAVWEAWLQNRDGYRYALENLFRQLVVVADNGRRMPVLSDIEWEQALVNGKDPLVTSKTDILDFLSVNTRKGRGKKWSASILVLAALGVAVWYFGVKRGLLLPRCEKCGRPASQCICGLESGTCTVCGLPLSECPGHGAEFPASGDSDSICPHCGLPMSRCTCTMVICPQCKRPKDQCVCTMPPSRTALLIDGIPLDRSDKTVLLSPYALKVLRGGQSAGTVLPLPKMGTLMGRERSRVAGAFIFLDMKDRPQLEKQCSRKYAKITARDDVLDVEVTNESGNDVRVDGHVISAKGEVLQARVGSRIELEPDWEFEVGEW